MSAVSKDVIALPEPYFLPVKTPRPLPQNNFTPQSIFAARLKENTTATSMLLGLVLPTTTLLNKELDTAMKNGEEISVEDMKKTVKRCGLHGLRSYGDRLARISCQTGIACAISVSPNTVALSTVYLWDLTPRAFRYHYENLFTAMKLPPFLGTLCGAAPTPADVAFMTAPASLSAVAEDTLKSELIRCTGDLIAVILQDIFYNTVVGGIGMRVSNYLIYAVENSCFLVCTTGGSVLGYAMAGPKGDFWGHTIGSLFSTFASTIAVNLLRGKKLKVKK